MSVNNSNQEQIRTREEYKQAKAEEQQQKKDTAQRAKDEKQRAKEEQKALKTAAKEQMVINGEGETAEAAPIKYQRVRIRMIPIWLRLVLLVALIFVSTAVGAVVGYGMLGDGKAADVFKESTWTHIVDLIDKR